MGATMIRRASVLSMLVTLMSASVHAQPAPAPQIWSSHPEAQQLMVDGEALFDAEKFDEALVKYQAALQLDPGLYEAAVFSGDVFLRHGDLAQAQMWYERAIAINPSRETAYRYSATPMMRQQQYEQARDRYVEAYILEPYNRLTVGGLSQWAQTTKTRIAHPAIEIPVKLSLNANGTMTSTVDPRILEPAGVADGSSLWVGYGLQRTAWLVKLFAERFPDEKVYRHSLTEEVDALRSVVRAAVANIKQLSPSLERLRKLDEEGLLEAYVLLARADQGIAADYPNYLREHRDTLRRYVTEYMLMGGGR